MNNETPIEGGCLCGEIRYSSMKRPFWVGHCHCRMCQRHTGTAFATDALFRSEHFTWLNGEPSWYKSSETTERGFCAKCGSTVAARYFSDMDIQIVAVGTLDVPDDVKPTLHAWTSSRLSWIHLTDGLKEYPEDEAESGL